MILRKIMVSNEELYNMTNQRKIKMFQVQGEMGEETWKTTMQGESILRNPHG